MAVCFSFILTETGIFFSNKLTFYKKNDYPVVYIDDYILEEGNTKISSANNSGTKSMLKELQRSLSRLSRLEKTEYIF